MYDEENNSLPADDGKLNPGSSADSTGPSLPPEKQQTAAIILNCPYCRKKFDRATTTSMPFCSPRCKQIDLGLWLNEVHGMPNEIDPGFD